MKRIILLGLVVLLAAACTEPTSFKSDEEWEDISRCVDSECLKRVCEKYGGDWVVDHTVKLGAQEYNNHECTK